MSTGSMMKTRILILEPQRGANPPRSTRCTRYLLGNLNRGPLVYAAEAVDNGARVLDLILP